MTATPILSVILIAGNQRQRAARALQSILTQAQIDSAEVLLIDVPTRAAPRLAGSDHPVVRLVPLPHRLSYGAMRAEAVKLARGAYVASLEEHCIALPGWIEAQLKRIAGGEWAGIGGEVHSLNPGQGISDLLVFMHYPLAWRAPAQFGISPGLPGHNSSYKRSALLQFGDDLPDLLQNETLLIWKLKERNEVLGIDPAMKFQHQNETSVMELAPGYYHMHRNFGVARAKLFHWTGWQRGLRLLSLPLLPLVRFMRYLLRASRENPAELEIVVRHALSIIMLQSITAIGLGVGYLFGPGDSGLKFCETELDLDRGGQATDER